MKSDQVNKIIEIIKNGNPNNNYINNQGLNSLGRILFYPKDNKEQKLSKEFKEVLNNHYKENYNAVIESLQRYHFTSFYTPKEIIDFKISLLKKNDINPKTILEPSAGNGAYIQILKQAFPNAKIIALEPDLFSFDILKLNNKFNDNVKCINTTFEEFYLNNKTSKFDLIISNIPFGDINIKRAGLHDYITDEKEYNVNRYFHKYMPKLLSHKGLNMVLTTKGFADKQLNQSIKEDILQNSDLIEIIRFNNELFKNENTKVVSDLIIFRNAYRKTELTPREKVFLQLKDFKLTRQNSEITFNQYLYEKRDTNVNGALEEGVFFNSPDITIIPDENNSLTKFLEQHLYLIDIPKIQSERLNYDEDIERTEKNIELKNIEVEKDKIKKEEVSQETLNQKLPKKEKSVYNEQDNLYILKNNLPYYRKNGNLINVPKKDTHLIISYISLRDKFIDIKDKIKNNDNAKLQSRVDDLKNDITLFNFQYGLLNDEYNKQIFIQDAYFLLLKNNIEHYNKELKTYEISPNLSAQNLINIFSPLGDNNVKDDLNTYKLKDRYESLKNLVYDYYDLNGSLDINEILNRYNETPENIFKQALETQLFYWDPIFDEHGRFLNYEVKLFYEIKQGDIDKKIEAYKTKKLPYDIKESSIINLMNSIKNAKLDINDIEFNFESVFIPKEVKLNFFRNKIDEKVDYQILQFQSSISLIFQRNHNSRAEELYTVSHNNERLYSYKKLLDNFVNNKIPVVYQTATDADGNKYRYLHEEATTVAQNKYEQLQLEFKDFIINNIEYKTIVEENYYNSFLAYKNLEIEDIPLKYPDSLINKPYRHQEESVMFSLLNGTSLNDHKVGHGKTLSMGMLSYKLLQHQKSKRILILTIKNVAKQMHDEIQTNFPNIKTVLLNSKNFSRKNASNTLNSIHNDESIKIIIAEHTHLPKFSKNKDIVESVINEKIEMINQDFQTAKLYGQRESSQVIKGLLKRKDTELQKIDTKYRRKIEKTAIKNGPNFEDLNIDALIVDECHKYKNIGYTTRHTNISGLNTNSQNFQNMDMEISIRSIHERFGYDKNIFFYSGTPIKNSVTELYAYQRYLTPMALKRMNIFNFDSWASIFLKQSKEIEPDILGNPREHTRFRYFTNLPELSKLYRSFTHISTDKTFKTHEIDVDVIFKELEPSDNILEVRDLSLEYLKSNNQIPLYGKNKYEEEKSAPYLTCLNLNRQVLVDSSLVNDLTVQFDDGDDIKIQQLCKDVYNRYKETEQHKGVSLIFSDIGVPSKSRENNYNTYNKIKGILTNIYNINPDEIGIIHKNEGSKLAEFQENIRKGKIRIAIGSTQKLGTGTNIQNRIVGIYTLDIPYSPDFDEQRLGRGLRKGNEVIKHYGNKLPFVKYAYKETTDIFSLSLNRHKEIFKDQIRFADPKIRIFDNMHGNKNEMSFSQMEASLLGDVSQIKLNKLESQYKALNSSKQLFELGKNNAIEKIRHTEMLNRGIITSIGVHKSANEYYKNIIPAVNSENTIKEIEQKTFEKYKEYTFLDKNISSYQDVCNVFTNTIDILLKNNKVQQEEIKVTGFKKSYQNEYGLFVSKKYNPILEKLGFTFFIKDVINNHDFEIHGKQQYRFDKSKLPFNLFKIIKEIDVKIKSLENSFNMNLKTIDSNKRLIGQEFPKEKLDKLTSLNSEIKEIKLKRSKRL